MIQRKKPGRAGLLVFFGLLSAAVVAGVIAGALPRLTRQHMLAAAAQEVRERLPLVTVTPARQATGKSAIELPGDLVALVEAPIFARADGFVKRRLVDLGYNVTGGQLMAELETPELDQQISQARATLAQSQATINELEAALELAHANQKIARLTADRWKELTAGGIFSRQDADEKDAALAMRVAETRRAEAALTTARETIRANEANLKRLEQLKGFAQVTAPFDGVVTSRTTDVGTLINSGNGGPSKEMFRVAQIDVIRVFVNVPQANVSAIQPGQAAEVRVQERPGMLFPARVTSIANSLDTNSRSMLAICRLENPKHLLFPGMFAQVRFSAPGERAALVIPGDAVMMSRSGPRVALVGEDKIVHFRNIVIGTDLGAEVEVASGLSPGDMVISNPTDAITDGARVEARRK